MKTSLSFEVVSLSLIHISEPTRLRRISYAVFCLKKIFLMIRRPPRSTPIKSSAASDVYKRQKPTKRQVEEAESAFDVETLIAEAMENIEKVTIRYEDEPIL